MLDWINNWQDHYKEKANGPFNFNQKNHYSSFLRSEVRFRFLEALNFSSWRLLFQERLSYVNKKPYGLGRVTGALVGSFGSFTVETLTALQNIGLIEAQCIFEPKKENYPSAGIGYLGEFSPSYQSHQLAFNITWSF